VVQKDGSVGRAIIIRSLDRTFGLDAQALSAVREWTFKPGTRMGEPVDVMVTIELTFTMK
jgi:TonB family protein